MGENNAVNLRYSLFPEIIANGLDAPFRACHFAGVVEKIFPVRKSNERTQTVFDVDKFYVHLL